MHCRSDPFVLCRQICLTSANAVSAAVVSVSQSVSSRVWVSGCGFFVLLVVWLAHVYVHREFESRSRHKVCPCCLGGAAVGATTLRHSSLGTYRVEGDGRAAGTLGNTALLDTLAQPVSSLVRLFSIESQNAIRMRGWYLSTPTTVIRICAYYIFYKAGISCVLVLGMCRYHNKIIDFVSFQVHISSQNHDVSLCQLRTPTK